MKTLSFLFLFTLSGSVIADSTRVKVSERNGVEASSAASQAAAHGIAASGKAAVGVLAAPAMLSGGAITLVGSGAVAIGQGLSGAAEISARHALPLTDEPISVMSPAEALRSRVRQLPANTVDR